MLSSMQAKESLQESLHAFPDNVPSHLKQALINAHHKLSDYYTKFGCLTPTTSGLLISHLSSCFLMTWTLTRFKFWTLTSHIKVFSCWLRWWFHNAMAFPRGHKEEQLCQHYLVPGQICEDRNPLPLLCCSPHQLNYLSGSPQKVNFLVWYKHWPQIFKDELEEFWKLHLEDFESCNPIQ